ncbi:hypothetical protein [Xanthomonas citri]|uniref:hypothetical protein n=1 Tax=Xanthomonas citri TaxID=346 RepID=UPI00178C5820|nr:hypothetical protein [Xanthomonas citri]
MSSIRGWFMWIARWLQHVFVHRRNTLLVVSQYAFAKYLRTNPRLGRILARLSALFRGTHRHTVAFVCFHTVPAWWDGYLPAGTAGSEEAVVHMSRQLARLGWPVVVYNHCGRKRTVNGVTYIPLWRYNLHEYHAVIVLWRDYSLLSFPIASGKIYVWLHDAVNDAGFASLIVDGSATVIVLSAFHRNSIAAVPDEHVFISRNGVDIPSWIDSTHARQPRKILYTSSPDRGLEILLALWPRIRASVPDAELFIYYGWRTWDFFHASDPTKVAWKERILASMEQPGVMTRFPHLDAAELWREYANSGFWIYPAMVGETSCISAIKAQAAGAVPICTSLGALAETVQWGARIDGHGLSDDSKVQESFVRIAVEALSSNHTVDRQAMTDWARARYGWASVAADWNAHMRDALAAAGNPSPKIISGPTG